MCLKLPAPERIAVVWDSPKSAKKDCEYPTKSLKKATMSIGLLEKLESHIKLESANSIEEIQIVKEQKVQFGTTLTKETKVHLIELLKNRVTTFT